MASKSGKSPASEAQRPRRAKSPAKAAQPKPQRPAAGRNPLLAKWTTPFEMPPFDRVKAKHFMPAFDRAFADNIAEIEAIAGDTAKPTFANTIDALERAGRGLDRVAGVFYNLAGTDTNDEIQKIEREVAPRFAKHGMRVYQNAKLFRRVDALFKKKGKLGLTRGAGAGAGALSPQLHPLRRGARCQGAQARWRRSPSAWRRWAPSSARTCWRTSRSFLLVLETEAELAGLPDAVRGGGRADGQRARPQGQARHQPVALEHRAVPAVLGAPRPARAGLQGLAAARRQRRQDRQPQDRRRNPEPAGRARAPARLQDGGRRGARVHHGQDAGQRAQAADGGVEAGARTRAREERDQLQEAVQAEGGNFKLAGWDWRYYAEKVRKTQFDVDEAEVKPYLQLDNVIAAAFDVASKLFGVTLQGAPRPARLSSRRAQPSR